MDHRVAIEKNYAPYYYPVWKLGGYCAMLPSFPEEINDETIKLYQTLVECCAAYFSWMQAETCLQKSQSNMGVIKNEEDEVPLDQEGIGSSDTSSSAEGTANDETKLTSNEVDTTSNSGMINNTTSSSWQEETNVDTNNSTAIDQSSSLSLAGEEVTTSSITPSNNSATSTQSADTATADTLTMNESTSTSTSTSVNTMPQRNDTDTAVPDSLPAYYTHDGSQNHPEYPNRGTYGTPRIREHPPLHSYIDNIHDEQPLWHHPRLDLPSARRILVELFQKVSPRPNEKASQFIMTFSVFIARDITRTGSFDGSIGQMDIACDMMETRGPFCQAGQRVMEFERASRISSSTSDGDGGKEMTSITGEPINQATTWLDLDHVYGNAAPSSPDYLKFRKGRGGQMKLDNSTGLPPINLETGKYLLYDGGMHYMPSHLALLSTFLHYHNNRATYWQGKHPEWDDETLFHKARMDTVAVYQATFETKYIPALLGKPLEDYEGYDTSVDARVDVFFSTSSFRYAHSVLSGVARIIDKDWEPLPLDPLLMRDIFKRNEDVIPKIDGGGHSAIAAILRGLAIDPAKAPDGNFVEDITLFTNGPVPKNIQRGRDNGLPSYNDAKEWFGFDRAESYLDLAGGDEEIASILEGLYGKGNIDDVDAYVGAMMEAPISKHFVLGPLNIASMQDQFERLRDGDRLYYRERLAEEEIEQLPLLSQVIKDVWGEDEMKYFPSDLFAVVSSGGNGRGPLIGEGGEIELFDGDLTVRWDYKNGEFIDFTMQSWEEFVGGYVGIGWQSRAMKGAEIWFCEYKPDIKFSTKTCVTNTTPPAMPAGDSGPFSCCVAPGKQHVRPLCDPDMNYLTVLDSCASKEAGSYVSVRAQLCSSDIKGNDCFSSEDDLDFIAAYNPNDVNAAHGFSRRTYGGINLSLGTAASCSDDSAQAGLFALHGTLLLISWLVLAPIAIWIVRYKKDKPWRLRVHIIIVGTVGGIMLALVSAALVGVEGTAFGTKDAESATWSRHKTFGISTVFFVAFMIATGEFRRQRTLTKTTSKSVALERAVIISHRLGGLLITGLAWYNCYTGLVQISPYEADSVEITVVSSKTFSLGYDLEIFGVIRKYIFIPWICLVIFIFLVTEIRVRLKDKDHRRTMEVTSCGLGNLLTFEKENDINEIMSVESFLFLTKHGKQLSIIDGYVIDIGNFIDVHPGGGNLLRFAVGTDITSDFIGSSDLNGQKHRHSKSALNAIRSLVKWKLENESKGPLNLVGGKKKSRISSFIPFAGKMSANSNQMRPTILGRVFRNATVVEHDIVSDSAEKYVIRLCLSVKRDHNLDCMIGTPLPTTTFFFRVVDSKGISIERPYSSTQSYLVKSEEKPKKQTVKDSLPLYKSGKRALSASNIVYEFFVSIVPESGGKLTSVLANKTVGRHIMVMGPLANKPFLQELRERNCSDLCLIVQGTGITPALQLIDYYLQRQRPPIMITLLWIVQDRNTTLENTLKLKDRVSSDSFRYVILSDNKTKSPGQGSDTLGNSPTLAGDATENRVVERQSTFEAALTRGRKAITRSLTLSTEGHVRRGQSSPEIAPNSHVGGEYELTGTGVKEGKRFLQLYSSKGIFHETAADALVSWLISEKRLSTQNLGSESVDLGETDKLAEIGDKLKSNLHNIHKDRANRMCFTGSDMVSCLVKEGCYPTRTSALFLGMELASRLSLFKHASDDSKQLMDDENEYYVFCDSDVAGARQRFLLNAERGTRHLDLTHGLCIGVCGHSSFESKLTGILKKVGLAEGQILKFPEGDTALAELHQFLDVESEEIAESKHGSSDEASELNSISPSESIILSGFHEVENDSDGTDDFKENE